MTKQDIQSLLLKGERVTLECKKAERNVPSSLWSSYSAFANTYGGVILLGVEEHFDEPDRSKRFTIHGVTDAQKVRVDLWNQANSRDKVNINLLHDEDVEIVDVDGKDVIYVHVPRADYNMRPVFINNKMMEGTFKRNHEGDYHCSESEIKTMIRDANEDGNDGILIEYYGMDDVDAQTLKEYRQEFRDEHYDHPWNKCDDKEFLKNLGGYMIERSSGREGLTLAGLLMFGKGLSIRERFSNFRMDYIDYTGISGEERYRYRLTYDGTWENNLYQFFHEVSPKLTRDLPRPFKMVGMKRIDDTPQHKAVREALTNSIIHSDVFLSGSILRIEKHDDYLCFRNPGTLKIPVETIYEGGSSKARNPRMQDMLRMIGLGENLGSGFPRIIDAWKEAKWETPKLVENQVTDEVILTLPVPFVKENMSSPNSPEFTKDFLKKLGIELTDRQEEILSLVQEDKTITSQRISQRISHKNSVSTRTIIKDMNRLQELGLLIREGSKTNGVWLVISPDDVITEYK